MIIQTPETYCRCDASDRAKLVVVIDTEEEFDWSNGFFRGNTGVTAMRQIFRVQDIFDRYAITPVYAIDYPIAFQADGYRPLQEIHSDRRCLIGAHLHPWVNPPFEEVICRANSFPGNLPAFLEREKLKLLGECIGERFGAQPLIYKAGRYGLGTNTGVILEDLGYQVDASFCPGMNYSDEEGPDFSDATPWPFWFGQTRKLLELPLTVGYTGRFRRRGSWVHCKASSSFASRFKVLGLLARLRLLNKVWLSPEGYHPGEQRALTRALYDDGLRVFTLAFHSPSVVPGNTPYVRSSHELSLFLDSLKRFFDFFMGELGGLPTTPLELIEGGALLNSGVALEAT